MVWVNGIGNDALARMEGVGAFGGKRLFRFAARRGFGFRSFHFHQGKIGDGAGPGKLGVIEFVKMSRGSGEARRRHDDENDVPQSGCKNCAAGDFALDPTLLEEAAIQKVLGDVGPGQNRSDAAEDALVKRTPGDFEFGAFARFEADGAGGRFGGLSKKVESVADVVQRHLRFNGNRKTNSSATAGGAKAPPLQKQPYGSEQVAEKVLKF